MPQSKRGEKPRIMYLENRSDGLGGDARISRVQFSNTGKTIYYDGRSLQPREARGHESNYLDIVTLEEFWIADPRKDGADRLDGEAKPVQIDADVREEYWTAIRGLPERKGDSTT